MAALRRPTQIGGEQAGIKAGREFVSDRDSETGAAATG